MVYSYRLNNPLEMISLAKKVSTRVYWNSSFYLRDDDSCLEKYTDFWEILESAFEEEAIESVNIEEAGLAVDIIEFIRKKS